MLHMAQPGNLTKDQCHWHTAGLAHVSMEVPPFTVILYQKSHTVAAAGSGELLFTGRSASPRTHPSPTSQYLIWIQDASNPVLSATHFHTHYISLFLLCVFTLHSRQRNCRRRCYRCLAVFLSHNHVSRRQNLFTYAETRTICLAALGACSRAFFWLLQTQKHVNSFSWCEMLSYPTTVYYSPVSNYMALFLIPKFSALISVLQCPFCHWCYSLVE